MFCLPFYKVLYSYRLYRAQNWNVWIETLGNVNKMFVNQASLKMRFKERIIVCKECITIDINSTKIGLPLEKGKLSEWFWRCYWVKYIDFIHLHIQLLLMEILFLHVMSIVNLERSNLTDKISKYCPKYNFCSQVFHPWLFLIQDGFKLFVSDF